MTARQTFASAPHATLELISEMQGQEVYELIVSANGLSLTEDFRNRAKAKRFTEEMHSLGYSFLQTKREDGAVVVRFKK